MPTFTVTFDIDCETLEQAQQVVAERLYPDEDYGFEYQISGDQITAPTTMEARG